jgi:hypothetical protein
MHLYPKATGETASGSIIRPLMKRKCSIGTYAPVLGFAECQPCPAGYQCPDSTKYPDRCADGSYSLEGWHTCGLCPAGKACYRHISAIDCPDGSYSLEGEIHCTIGPPGTDCRLKDQNPQKCQPGYYSYGNTMACTICPVGHFCLKPDAPPNVC